MPQSESYNRIGSLAALRRGDYNQSKYAHTALAIFLPRCLEIAELPAVWGVSSTSEGDFDNCALLGQKSTFRVSSNNIGAVAEAAEPR